MEEEEKLRDYLCSSADWDVIIEDCASHEEAASSALQRLIESASSKFSVGAVISVCPIKVEKEELKLIYSPSILADIGMHKHAAELIKQIDKNV